MQYLRDVLSDVWTAMNPSEPSPAYLFKFLMAAIMVFIAAYLIGRGLGLP
ncbi:hypothetical protein P1J78_16815 [Psychromarinibacter sp. C21-152]|uniref:Uncharacterized protein n=1 Tax=Psychromarinibacter sediminicola TaxID=3033385 RepID=A0AAE3NQK9_9RHOB|nr:hypothetical protein [Psychromarinibacter sediminicola]MDF0602403.1 hypothetical protein [Psychromarinibacter sediminicola]